ncbi:sigma-54 dependent transcriptional regulator [Lutibacter sp.]|uniref:sigma-54-dependent transcriptional regulator n=1 Tax=Lutibacter sp. TaxID=1925666 RepID=UPI0027339A7B|nr:sigma-54 dependent transcriptional regulator [Lutibacter sp.]MDP3314005.1 sigma-54 dependent transcriptional regulator [Lutibacter sp.]
MKKNLKIMVVDDERILRVTIADDLKDAGYLVREYANAQAALIDLKEFEPNIVITDVKMPGLSGIELLSKIKRFNADIAVIVMTAHGTIETAVQTMKLGAYDYLLKPFVKDEILLMIERICELHTIKNENKILRKNIEQKFDFSTYIGESEVNKEIYNLINLIAEKDSTVLIIGETGTGKEHITNIIHYNSQRKNKPLIKVSCAILSREIFESELFGHVKGAFTGADQDKKGRFELADGGTLYLDDIDDIPLDLQVKLLRVLQESEIEKVGSAATQKIDIRIIASTKKNLRQMVNEGKFREDLYYRLNIFPINLLPLRERKKDIKIIFKHYVQKYLNNINASIDNEVFNVLEKYPWPGNIRELKNIAERMVILSSNDSIIEVKHIPIGIRNPIETDINKIIGNKTLEETLSEIEIASIKLALEKSKQNKTKAADILGIPPSTLRTKMDKYKLG